MTDQQQVEIWRKDFELIVKKDHVHLDLDRSVLGRYLWMGTEALWQGFLMAKRAQKPVELPKPFLMDDADGNGRGEYLMLEMVENRLQKAGIPYTVKGE